MSAAEMHAGAAPERTPDWHSIQRKKVCRAVRRLQARIVKAVPKRPRSARGVRECLSWMKGNCAPRNAAVESLTQSGGARRNAPESSD